MEIKEYYTLRRQNLLLIFIYGGLFIITIFLGMIRSDGVLMGLSAMCLALFVFYLLLDMILQVDHKNDKRVLW